MKRNVAAILLCMAVVAGALGISAYGQAEADSNRTISGYDVKTNHIIDWHGVLFSLPSYFDTLDDGATEEWMTYYPEPENYYASLLFQSYAFGGTNSEFEEMLPSVVSSILAGDYFASATILQSEALTIAGLQGWTISFQIADEDDAGEFSAGGYSFAFHENAGTIVLVSFVYDSKDQSRYDYMGDYQKLLSTAILAGTETVPVSKSVTITYQDTVNVRKEADANSSRVGVAHPGKTYAYYETADNGWHRIQLEDGTIGWISGKMGTVIEGASGNINPKKNEAAEALDLNAINNTNSEKYDAQFVGKSYLITGIVGEAYGPTDGSNALVTIYPDVFAKGMLQGTGFDFMLDINIWMTPDEYKAIGGDRSVGKQITIIKVLTSIARNGTSKDPSIRGYPIQLEFGTYD